MFGSSAGFRDIEIEDLDSEKPKSKYEYADLNKSVKSNLNSSMKSPNKSSMKSKKSV